MGRASRWILTAVLGLAACSDATPAADGRAGDALRADASAADRAHADMRPREKVRALRVTTPVTVDGDLGEWSTPDWLTIEGAANWISVTKPLTPPPPSSNLSARLAARWEPDALYLFVEVTDDVHSNTFGATSVDIWQGDSLQLGFDTANNLGTPYDSTDDYEYGFALSAGKEVIHTWQQPTGSPAFAGAYKVVRADPKTRYEVKLLPADLKKSGFSVGMTLGFVFMVNEDDGAGRIGFVEWMSGIGIAKDPSLFGLLELQP